MATNDIDILTRDIEFYKCRVHDFEQALNHIATWLMHTYGAKPEQPAATYIEDAIKQVVDGHIANGQKLEKECMRLNKEIEQLTRERDAAINGQDGQAKIIGTPVTELETKVSQLTAEKAALVTQLNRVIDQQKAVITNLRISRANWQHDYEQFRDAYMQLEEVYNKTLGQRIRNNLKSLLGRE